MTRHVGLGREGDDARFFSARNDNMKVHVTLLYPETHVVLDGVHAALSTCGECSFRYEPMVVSPGLGRMLYIEVLLEEQRRIFFEVDVSDETEWYEMYSHGVGTLFTIPLQRENVVVLLDLYRRHGIPCSRGLHVAVLRETT